jgi:hypothetical protein
MAHGIADRYAGVKNLPNCVENATGIDFEASQRDLSNAVQRTTTGRAAR